uniref:Putative secreted protein n=1 Tax=Ixodes ricinus TaxID=34613 RepID=A0A147BFK5_IXORI
MRNLSLRTPITSILSLICSTATAAIFSLSWYNFSSSSVPFMIFSVATPSLLSVKTSESASTESFSKVRVSPSLICNTFCPLIPLASSNFGYTMYSVKGAQFTFTKIIAQRKDIQ